MGQLSVAELRESDSRLVHNGFNRSTALALLALSAVAAAVAVGLDLMGLLDELPVTANIIAGLMAVPATAVVTSFLIDRSIRSRLEQQLARRIYFSSKKTVMLHRPLRLAMYRAYLGTDSVQQKTLDVVLARQWADTAERLRAPAEDTSLEEMHTPTPIEVTEVHARAAAFIDQVAIFLEVIETTPYRPALQFTLGGKLNELRFRLAAYETVLSNSYGHRCDSPVLQRAEEMDSLAQLLIATVEASNEIQVVGEGTALEFNYAYFAEDATSPEESRRQVEEVFQAARYQFEDRTRGSDQGSP